MYWSSCWLHCFSTGPIYQLCSILRLQWGNNRIAFWIFRLAKHAVPPLLFYPKPSREFTVGSGYRTEPNCLMSERTWRRDRNDYRTRKGKVDIRRKKELQQRMTRHAEKERRCIAESEREQVKILVCVTPAALRDLNELSFGAIQIIVKHACNWVWIYHVNVAWVEV